MIYYKIDKGVTIKIKILTSIRWDTGTVLKTDIHENVETLLISS